MTSSLPAFLKSSVASRLGMCALALAGSLGTMTHASAAIVTFSTPLAIPNNFDGLYINFATGGSAPLGSGITGWDFNSYNSGVSLSFFWSATPSQAGGVASTATGPYLELFPGATISAGSTFAAVTATANTASFQTPGTHYLGFRFYNESTAAVNYGYLSLTSGGATGFPLTVNGWSFENSGGAITIPTSVVPEPSTTVLGALGALALGTLALRRSRRERRLSAA